MNEVASATDTATTFTQATVGSTSTTVTLDLNDSQVTVASGAGADTVIATLGVTDVDGTDAYTFTTNTAGVKIVGTELQVDDINNIVDLGDIYITATNQYAGTSDAGLLDSIDFSIQIDIV